MRRLMFQIEWEASLLWYHCEDRWPRPRVEMPTRARKDVLTGFEAGGTRGSDKSMAVVGIVYEYAPRIRSSRKTNTIGP